MKRKLNQNPQKAPLTYMQKNWIKHAIQGNRLKRVQSMVQEGHIESIVDDFGDGGRNMLHTAIFYQNANVVQYLLEQGADVEKCDSLNRPPLSCALEYGTTKIVKLLLAKGANVNAKNGVAFVAALEKEDFNGPHPPSKKDISLLLSYSKDLNVTLSLTLYNRESVKDNLLKYPTAKQAFEEIKHHFLCMATSLLDQGNGENPMSWLPNEVAATVLTCYARLNHAPLQQGGKKVIDLINTVSHINAARRNSPKT